MLTLFTTTAALHLDVDDSARRSLLCEARFVPETAHQLATGEFLRDLDCSLRILPQRESQEFHASIAIGWLCIIVDGVNARSGGPSKCLVETSVDGDLFDELLALASAAHLPSRVDFGLAPIGYSPQEGVLSQVITTTEFPLAKTSFTVPLACSQG